MGNEDSATGASGVTSEQLRRSPHSVEARYGVRALMRSLLEGAQIVGGIIVFIDIAAPVARALLKESRES